MPYDKRVVDQHLISKQVASKEVSSNDNTSSFVACFFPSSVLLLLAVRAFTIIVLHLCIYPV